MDFSEDYELLIPSDNVGAFNEILCRYAKGSLISKAKSDDYIFTRTGADEVVSLIDGWRQELIKKTKPLEDQGLSGNSGDKHKDGSESGGNTPEGGKKDDNGNEGSKNPKGSKHKKPATYFEDLKCTVEDQRLKRITTELIELSKKNRMEKFSVCGAMLTRALLESSLLYQVNIKGKLPNYYQSLEYEKDGKKYVSKPGLTNLVSFVRDNINDLFDINNIKNATKALEQVKGKHLDYLNSIVHGSWLDPTGDKIHVIAGDIRELLRAILNGGA